MDVTSARVNLSAIESNLSTQVLGRPSGVSNEFWDEIDSTNSRLCELARQGAPEGLLVIARQQTAGRGRLGRTWISPADSGIFLSVLLRPKEKPVNELSLLTLAVGVAVASAVEKVCGIQLGLKWVNDLVFDGKKIGGILAEMPGLTSPSANSESCRAIIVGIGINLRLTPDAIPDELVSKIDWIERIAGQPVDPNLLASAILNELENMYQTLLEEDSSRILKAWKQRSVTLGKNVSAVSGISTFEGVAKDVTDKGALIVETSEGEIKELAAGEVTIRNPSGSYY